MSRAVMGSWVVRHREVAKPRATASSTHLGALDVAAFLVPAISFLEVAVVGRLIVSEVLLLVMLPWLWSARDRSPIPMWFLVVWTGWLVGQVITDLVVGTGFDDLVRGWAAIAFTMTDFAAILILVSTPRRARIFAAGLAAGGVLGYLFVPNAFAAGDPWKWAFAMPVGFTLAAALSGRRGARHPWVSAGVFVGFGVLNLMLGFRSLGGVSLLAAGYLALSTVAGRPHSPTRQSILRAGGALMALAISVVVVLQLYDVAASDGLLGQGAQAKYMQQSGAFGVLLGGRSESLASSQAIIDSPVLGHGSWAKDFKYVDLLAERASSLGYQVGASLSDIGMIPTHSYLLGSWVWAGFLGGLFWITIALVALWLLANLYTARLELEALLAFSTMLLLWNIMFSPYGFSARIDASYGIALCLLGLRTLRGQIPGPSSSSGAPVNRGRFVARIRQGSRDEH